MSLPLILRLDITGKPVKWIPWQEAVCLYAKDMVAWTAGENCFILRGGFSRLSDGQQTRVEINSIVAVRGEFRRGYARSVPPLSNRELFSRDQHTCLYCGHVHTDGDLTRDHIKPVSKGGKDIWSNVVTACRRCNARKGCRTLEESHMPLLAVPYIPNMAEYLVLRNRRILADQMEFLKLQYKENTREWPLQ